MYGSIGRTEFRLEHENLIPPILFQPINTEERSQLRLYNNVHRKLRLGPGHMNPNPQKTSYSFSRPLQDEGCAHLYFENVYDNSTTSELCLRLIYGQIIQRCLCQGWFCSLVAQHLDTPMPIKKSNLYWLHLASEM